MQVSAADAAKTVLEEFEAKLIVLVVYGLQPSASTQNMTAAGNIAQKIKESNPGAKIMMTGTHPAALPYETMKSIIRIKTLSNSSHFLMILIKL